MEAIGDDEVDVRVIFISRSIRRVSTRTPIAVSALGHSSLAEGTCDVTLLRIAGAACE